MQLSHKQISEKLEWFLAAYPTKYRIKLSFAHRAIESSLGESIEPEDVYRFLKDNKYKHIVMDLDIKIRSSTQIGKQKDTPTAYNSIDLDDLDDILNEPLKPKVPGGESIKEFHYPSHHMNEHLLREYDKTHDRALLHNLVVANMNLVHSVALRYKNYMGHSLSDEDLVQEGVFGLMEAIERYDYMKGFSLSTYATHWISQRVIRAIINSGTTVRIPVHMVELIRKVKRTEARLSLEFGEQVPISRVCEELDITEEKYHQVKLVEHRFLSFTSLNQPIGIEENDSELLDFIPNDRLEVLVEMPVEFHDPYELTEKKILKENLGMLLNSLTDREKMILEYRFGLIDGIDRTLEEVGKMLGVTRERIRQIEARALQKLRDNQKNMINGSVKYFV